MVSYTTESLFLLCLNELMKDQIYEWPEINFGELWDYTIENIWIQTLYKSLLALLILPEIIITAFYQVLKFKG